ncbi:MAG: hypothetical protein R3263_02720 [Myxococcota bacterium]|nr:hypothetical protein [Myxococcota bacterium]
MELFLFTFAGLGLAFAAMGLGALAGRAPLRRGCGLTGSCAGCARPCPHRADGKEPHP